MDPTEKMASVFVNNEPDDIFWLSNDNKKEVNINTQQDFHSLKSWSQELSNIHLDVSVLKEFNSSDLNLGPYLGLGPNSFDDNGPRVLANIDYYCSLLNANVSLVSPIETDKPLTFLDITGRENSMIEYLQWRFFDSTGLGIVDKDPFKAKFNINYEYYNQLKQPLESVEDSDKIKVMLHNTIGAESDLVLSDKIYSDIKTFRIQVYTACKLTRVGGSCVIRLPENAVLEEMYNIYYLLTLFWEKISIITPIAGEIYNFQRYFVGSVRTDNQNLDILTSSFNPNIDSLFLARLLKNDSQYLRKLHMYQTILYKLIAKQMVSLPLYNINNIYTMWSYPEYQHGWKLYNNLYFRDLITWTNS